MPVSASQPCVYHCQRLRMPNSLHLCPGPLIISSISQPGGQEQVMAQLHAPGPAGTGRVWVEVWVEAAVPALSGSLCN